MPASSCALVTLATKTCDSWHEPQLVSMCLVNEWQDKQEPAFGCLAMAGVKRKLALL